MTETKVQQKQRQKRIAHAPDGWDRSDKNPAGRSGVKDKLICDTFAPIQYTNRSRAGATITEVVADGRWMLEVRDVKTLEVIERSRHWDPYEAAFRYASRLRSAAEVSSTARPASEQSKIYSGVGNR